MTTKIRVEPLQHPDGRPLYNGRGQLYRTRAGGPDGPVLCERTLLPATDSCRVLVELGITGHFETWHADETMARLTGDIVKAAKVTVEESNTKAVQFRSYIPHPASGDAISRAPARAPARESDRARGVIAQNSETLPTLDGHAVPGNCTYASREGAPNKAGLNESR